LNTFTRLSAFLFVISLVGACDTGADGLDLAEYEAEVMSWREERRARLMAPTGYLTQAGLFWLDKPVTTFGSAEENDVLFTGKAAPRIGEFRLTAEGVLMLAEPGVDVRFDDEIVQTILIADDTTDNPMMITHGSLAWTVIKRDERFAVRLRDFEHPVLETFPALEYFPIVPEWRVQATFRRYDEPRTVAVDTVIEGLGWNPESPGVVVFEKDGEDFELEAYSSGDELFFVFGDLSNGRETYPAGRFLYATIPDEGDQIVLDFNRSYSPPCAFNDFSTCPVASARNRLPTAVAAGELFNRDAYSASH
jgi:uncharacterized protein (DUF1684 family)